MVCPNHSNRHDPQIMFAFSKLVGEDFNFIAAREVFEWATDPTAGYFNASAATRSYAARRSRIIQNNKTTSVRRQEKLVLFSEGEISRQNDTLMPLESGAAQMTFWALDEMAKKDGGTLPELPIIPVALKYTFAYDIRQSLSICLREMEARLAIKPEGGVEILYPRLRKVAETLLKTLELEYGFKPAPDATWNDRITNLRGFILDSRGMPIECRNFGECRQLESVRVLRNAMDDFIYQGDHDGSDYQKKNSR